MEIGFTQFDPLLAEKSESENFTQIWLTTVVAKKRKTTSLVILLTKSIYVFWPTTEHKLWRTLAVHQGKIFFAIFIYVLIFWYFIQNSGVVHILLYITIVFLLKSTLFLLFSVIYGWVFSPCFFFVRTFFQYTQNVLRKFFIAS